MPDESGVHAFQVDLRGLVDLLSHHLYSSPRVFVRELLQNAVDAITARRQADPDAPAEIRITLDGVRAVRHRLGHRADRGGRAPVPRHHRQLGQAGRPGRSTPGVPRPVRHRTARLFHRRRPDPGGDQARGRPGGPGGRMAGSFRRHLRRASWPGARPPRSRHHRAPVGPRRGQPLVRARAGGRAGPGLRLAAALSGHGRVRRAAGAHHGQPARLGPRVRVGARAARPRCSTTASSSSASCPST